MRAFFNGILAILLTTSLTDDEFDTVEVETPAYNQENYDALSAILAARESVSDIQTRLYYYFKARGADITEATTGKSNILVGAVLE